MFEHLAKHRKILVTGPHRSGTTFAATAIAHDLCDHHGLVREELCWMPALGLRKIEAWLLEVPMSVVVQAPFVADTCHRWPGVFIVYMHRNVDEIKRSQKRMYTREGKPVAWHYIERTERDKYQATDSRSVPEIKYDAWKFQRRRLHPDLYWELPYEDLQAHPLWVPAPLRKRFHVRQTTHAVG